MRLLFILLTTWTTLAYGQGTEATDCQSTYDSLTKMEVYSVVDTPPTVIGGWHDLYSEIGRVKIPRNSETDHISISVSFVVNSNGEIEGLRTDKNETTLDNELLICLKKFVWKPGVCKGRKVPTKLVLSIKS